MSAGIKPFGAHSRVRSEKNAIALSLLDERLLPSDLRNVNCFASNTSCGEVEGKHGRGTSTFVCMT
jgi:hypothetical protein